VSVSEIRRPPMRRRRERSTDAPRRRMVLVRFNDSEQTTVAAAAERAGLTTTGYVASVAVSLASATPAALTTSPWREVLLELIATRGQVRRFAVNVNQAVAALNATGETPPELAAAVAVTTRAVARLDLIAADLQRRLR
jgi:hypothetical protein